MIVSTKGRYALRTIIDVAMNQNDANVPMGAVAKRQDISAKYLESIAKQLVNAGILTSTRGKSGGYRLAKKAEEITVGEVLRAAEGNLAAVACLQNSESCPRFDMCPTLPIWQGLDNVVNEYLDSSTIADLIDSIKSFEIPVAE